VDGGSLIVELDDRCRRPGGVKLYTDLAIEAALPVRMVYHMPLQQLEGFLRSVFSMLRVDLPVPDHTTRSRQGSALGELALGASSRSGVVHVLIDSTVLRIHVGGSWTPPKDRAWRKPHLAVDRESGEILAAELKSRKCHDSTRAPRLLKRIGGVVHQRRGEGQICSPDAARD